MAQDFAQKEIAPIAAEIDERTRAIDDYRALRQPTAELERARATLLRYRRVA